MAFDYSRTLKLLIFANILNSMVLARVSRGVLLVEPYKSEILPYWRFKTPDIARESSEKIYELFLAYLEQEEHSGVQGSNADYFVTACQKNWELSWAYQSRWLCISGFLPNNQRFSLET